MDILGWIADAWYTGVCALYSWLCSLPWPTGREWFKWFLFLIAGKLLWWFIGMQVSKKYSIRTSENGAAAIVSSLFDRH